ncbi:MAG: ArnT family glycosyltransferase [Candidatus Rokuibacteriota bacterium]
MSLRHPRLALLAVLALAAVVLTVPVGRKPFWSSDEARFAVLAQDILDHGRWLVPELRGDLYLNKPQLYFWSIALVSLPGGRVTEMTAAIPSLVSALATLGAVAAIGRLLWGWPVGLLAALVLATTPPFYVFGHAVLSDVMMTAWMTWALYFLVRASREGWTLGPVIAFHTCVGAAVLSKGPAGLAVLAAAVVAIVATFGVRALPGLRPGWALAVYAVFALAWVVPYMTQSQGRFVSNVLVGHYGPWYLRGGLEPRLSQVGSLFVNFLPWTTALAAAVVWWWRDRDEGRRLLGVATLGLLVVLALAGTPRARYLLPVYPGLALLAAEFLCRAAGGARGAVGIASWAFTALLLALAAAAPFLLPGVRGDDRTYVPDGTGELALLVTLLVVAAIVNAAAAWRGAYAAGAAAAAVVLLAVLMVESVCYPPRYARDNDLRPLAEAATRHAGPTGVVVAYPEMRLSFDFYTPRPVVIAETRERAREAATATPSAMIATVRHWAEIAPLLPSWRVVGRRQVADRDYVVAAP